MPLSFTTRTIIAVIGGIVFAHITILPIEKMWAHLGAIPSNLTYQVQEQTPHPYGFSGTFQEPNSSIWFQITPYCTYLWLTAVILPLAITHLKLWPIMRGLIWAILISSVINLFRMFVMNWFLCSNYPLKITHDVIHITASCTGIAIGACLYISYSKAK